MENNSWLKTGATIIGLGLGATALWSNHRAIEATKQTIAASKNAAEESASKASTEAERLKSQLSQQQAEIATINKKYATKIENLESKLAEQQTASQEILKQQQQEFSQQLYQEIISILDQNHEKSIKQLEQDAEYDFIELKNKTDLRIEKVEILDNENKEEDIKEILTEMEHEKEELVLFFNEKKAQLTAKYQEQLQQLTKKYPTKESNHYESILSAIKLNATITIQKSIRKLQALHHFKKKIIAAKQIQIYTRASLARIAANKLQILSSPSSAASLNSLIVSNKHRETALQISDKNTVHNGASATKKHALQ